jgi:signal transduction histidine kinase
MAWFTVTGALAYDLSPQRQPARHLATHGVWIARLGMIAIFSLPVFAGWSVFHSSAPQDVKMFRLTLTLASMVVMGGMVFIRQHMLDRELLDLVDVSQQSFENLSRLQEQLLKSEKLASLGQLIGGAAHELNNPLAAMLGYSDLLAGTQLTDEQRTLSQKIGQQVRRTQSFISSLLTFAKQGSMEKVLVDVDVLVGTAVRLAQAQLRARNIDVRTEFGDQLPPVLGDSNQFLQVFAHIMNDAQPVMQKDPGILRVSTRLEQNFVIVEFSDNGSRILQQRLGSDPFGTVRLSGSAAGVGFSACQSIIREHGGSVVCEHNRESGTIIRIQLPVALRTGQIGAQPLVSEASV